MTEITVTLIFLLLVVALFVLGAYHDKQIGIKDALILLGFYLLFILSQFGIGIINKST